jgi:hypothetical protein
VRGKAVERGGRAEPYPLFVLVRLSDHCRLALVLLVFILIFLVFVIVIIGISRWGVCGTGSEIVGVTC